MPDYRKRCAIQQLGRPVSTEPENPPVFLLLAFRCQCDRGVIYLFVQYKFIFIYLHIYLLYGLRYLKSLHSICIRINFTYYNKLLLIIIIINRQFLRRRNIETKHPLQRCEMSMYTAKNIDAFSCQLGVKQMIFKSGFERPQRLKIPDV